MQALVRFLGVMLMLSALAVSLTQVPDRSVESLVARWAPPPSDFMDVHGQIVHVRDEGPRDDRLPIVLVHGLGSSLHTWQGWAGALRSRRRVITFDLPGAGLTGPFAGAYARDDYRADVLARFTLDLLDTLHVQRFVIGGNSRGGEVAWRVAAAAPRRVDRLILVDATGYPSAWRLPNGLRLDRLPLLGWIGEALTPRPLVENSLREAWGDPARLSDVAVDRAYEMLLREGNRRALSLHLRQIPADFAPERIKSLRVPTLILRGDRDRVLPASDAAQFARDIPGSRLVVLPGLGHLPQEEDAPQSFVPVRDFLGLDAPASSSTTPLPAAPAASEPA